ncbi:antitoxin VapB39 [Mycobacterium lacus]|uniref:Antitoxin VapB39 n=2 Tax=Mycobacterium lacus TaxID=169765 RepID=A0A7I7NHZ6_9MYCO|nr:antitoxin VapB39 [Mycobacterium lacus]
MATASWGLLPKTRDLRRYHDAMRTTLQIDDDVLEDARDIARAEGRSVGAVISELARRSLRPVGMVEIDGFPVFDVPSDAPVITDEDVARALEEDV